MANYALVKNKTVENVIIADADFIELIKSEWDEIVEVVESDYIVIGSTKVKNKWVAPVSEQAAPAQEGEV